MTALVFVDTNVLIYALDPADPTKQRAAQTWRANLWNSESGRISFQVLQEFYVKAVQKWPTAREQARAEVRDLLSWRPLAVSSDLLHRAWQVQDRYQISFWDALIVAAAKTLGCGYLLSEDLQPDQSLDGVMVVNPFLRDPDSVL
jgi:predicted nucleic acid-binding protein